MRLYKRIKHFFVPSHGNAYRPRLLHRPWLIFFFVVILATEGFLVSNLIARQSSQNFLAAVVPGEIIALTNTERAENNAGVVTEDALLDKAAQAKADDMAANGYFSHVGPDGKTPWQWVAGSGYKYQYAGENLAVRFVDSADVINAWMESPTHRANIVKGVYTAIGVGVAQGMYEGQSATFVVQYFATPLGGNTAHVAAASSQPVQPAAAQSKPHVAVSKPVAPVTTPEPVVVSISETPRADGQVEGATTATAPVTTAANNVSSYSQNFFKQVLRAFAEPKATTNWILGICATILILVLCLTFFMHLHIQPTNMLLGGAFVALFALSLIGLNSRLGVGADAPGNGSSLAASPVEAQGLEGVVISGEAASTGYALFPRQ